jgi:hypothetical protein
MKAMRRVWVVAGVVAAAASGLATLRVVAADAERPPARYPRTFEGNSHPKAIRLPDGTFGLERNPDGSVKLYPTRLAPECLPGIGGGPLPECPVTSP